MNKDPKLEDMWEDSRTLTLYGMESMDQAPTLEIQRIAELLRQPPAKPVKTSQMFRKLLGIKKHRNQYGSGKYDVRFWLQRNLHDERIIDHYMEIVIDNGDVMLLVQPYHHPNKEDVKKFEAMGGYVVCPHAAWGFMHRCHPNVYLVPAGVLRKFSAFSDAMKLQQRQRIAALSSGGGSTGLNQDEPEA